MALVTTREEVVAMEGTCLYHAHKFFKATRGEADQVGARLRDRVEEGPAACIFARGRLSRPPREMQARWGRGEGPVGCRFLVDASMESTQCGLGSAGKAIRCNDQRGSDGPERGALLSEGVPQVHLKLLH